MSPFRSSIGCVSDHKWPRNRNRLSTTRMSTSKTCGLGCQVCQVSKTLIGLGAQCHQSDRLSEGECEVRVSIPAATSCVAKLKMDADDDAKYRQKSGSTKRTRMCDFTVALAIEGEVRYCAIELKSGEPYLNDATEQLREGLRAIVEHLVEGTLKPKLRAILVVGVMSPRLMKLARSPDGGLSVAGRKIQIELADCGAPLRI